MRTYFRARRRVRWTASTSLYETRYKISYGEFVPAFWRVSAHEFSPFFPHDFPTNEKYRKLNACGIFMRLCNEKSINKPFSAVFYGSQKIFINEVALITFFIFEIQYPYILSHFLICVISFSPLFPRKEEKSPLRKYNEMGKSRQDFSDVILARSAVYSFGNTARISSRCSSSTAST